MILTTTQSIEGRTIVEYKGIVFGEVITGVNFIKDIDKFHIYKFYVHSSQSREASLVAQLVKNPPAVKETPVQFLGRENPLEKG